VSCFKIEHSGLSLLKPSQK